MLSSENFKIFIFFEVFFREASAALSAYVGPESAKTALPAAALAKILPQAAKNSRRPLKTAANG
jgi:hypothetical protein